jgi:peptidylprolyl isomerase
MFTALHSRVFHLSAGPLLLFTLQATAAAPTDVIAQGGSVTLNAADVRSLVTALPATDRAQVAGDAATLEKLVRTEIVSRSLLGEARAKAFDKQPDTVLQLDRLRDEALVRLWVASHAALPAGFPTEADITAAFEANKLALVSPTQYRIGQIFIGTPDGLGPAQLSTALRKATDVGARVAGGDFGKLAQEQSEHAESAGKGGDMGFLPENQLAPEVLAAVRALKVGEVVGPIKTAQGLHYFKLLDRKAGAALTLAEAHDALANALRTRRANELAQAYLADLGTRLAISVNQIELTKLQATLR